MIVLALVALSACVPTPKPFAHDAANDRAYAPKEDKPDVVIAPPTNMPIVLGHRVAAALALELQAYGIVGTIEPGKAPARVTGVMSTHDAPLGLGLEIDVDWSLAAADGVKGPSTTKTVIRP